MTLDRLMGLIEGVYDAALDHDAWPVFLAGLADAFGGLGAVIVSSDVVECAGEIIAAARYDPVHLASYRDHYAAVDPWTAPFTALAPGIVASTDEALSRRVLLRTEFYNDWLRPQGIERSLGAVLLREGRRHVRLGIPRADGQGAYDEQAVHDLALLVPHLRRALQLRTRLAGVEVGGDGAAEALDRLHMGVVLVDAGGRIIHMNAAARAIVAAADGLAVAGGIIGVLRASDDQRLKALITSAATATSGLANGRDPGGALALARPSGLRPYSVLVAPLPRDAITPGPARLAAVVFVSDPEDAAEPPRAALMRLYGFTVAEARLAAALLAGESLATAADTQGMVKGTARAHLQRIFKKTDTHGQPELIRLLLASPAALVRR